MCPEYSIRPVTIAESAMRAAQRQAETGERQYNPMVLGTPAHHKWAACFERALQLQTCPDCDGCA